MVWRSICVRRRTWLYIQKDAIVLLRTIYWSLAAILIPCIIAIIILIITYVNLADEKPTQYGGVALGGISEPFTHSDVYLNLTDPEDSSTNSGDQQTDEEDNRPNELASNETLQRMIAFAKVLEDKIKLRRRPHFKYSYHIQRKNMGETRLTISISPSATSTELPREKLATERIYNVEPSKVTLYEKYPVDFHLALCMKFFQRDIKREPDFREAILFPYSGFRIRKWTETYPNVVLLALVPVVVMSCKRVGAGRNSEIMELMISMDTDMLDFYLSHALFAYLHNFMVTGILIFPAVFYFINVGCLFSIILMNLVLGIPAALISLVCSTFSKSSLTAAIWCFLVWMGLFLASLMTPRLDSNSPSLYILHLNPLASFKSFFENIAIYHIRGSMEKGLLTVVYPDVFTMLESFVYMVTSCFLMILYLFLFEISSLEYFKCQLRSNKVQSMTSEPSSDNEQEFVDRAVFLDKVYKSWQTKESAISDVSFGAFYGQVTVLLGHDGCGKSTIMKLISGDIDATRGSIYVFNMRKGRRKSFYCKDIGYCSQRIALFENLTVLEHLWFFYCLKTGRTDWSDDVSCLANDVGLNDYLRKKTSKLDEKRKRLLTLAISMVGGSSLVLMDEPFKGLDAETKDLFRKILERNKEGRCFLVATSSAETAEMIADRIVMLYNGRVLALGPIPSLKAEFGCNYVLNVLLSSEASSRENIVEEMGKVVRKLVPTAELRLTCGKLVQFGFNSNNHEEQIALLRGLEGSKEIWGISEYYVTICTVMDVYRRVEVLHLNEDIEEDQLEEETKIHRGKCPFARQFCVLLKKRLYLLPNRHCCLAVVTVPIALVIFTVMSISNRGDADPIRFPSISLDMYDHGRFIIYDPNNMTEKARKVLENVLVHPNIEIIWTHSDNLCESWPNDWPFVVGAVAFGEDIGLAVVDEEKCTFKMPYPLMTDNKNGTCERWGCFHKTIFQTVDDEHDEIWLVPNIATFGYHAIIQEVVQGRWKMPWEKLHVDVEIAAVKSDSSNTSMLIIGIAHVILLSAFVIVPVQERSCNFKRQQILSGASVLTYWLAHFLFDALIAVITVSICLLFVVILHSAPSFLLSLAMYTYVIGGLPCVYFMSLIFRSSHQAFIVLTAFTACYPFVVFFLIREDMQNFLITELPTVAFFSALKDRPNTQSESSLFCSILIKFVVFMLLLLLVESKFWRRLYKSQNSLQSMKYFDSTEWEREYGSDDENGAEKPFTVRGVPFHIRSGEIIGFLGRRNDTIPTVLDIVQRQSTISCPCFTSYTKVGFCPRQEFLYPLLSPYRNLKIIAGIAGKPTIKNSKIVEASTGNEPSLLRKRTQASLSAMNRRRVSVVAAMLSKTPVLAFEMPTKGVDVRTRRFTWSAMRAAQRAGRSILFATDSAEECEVLCDRVGIVYKGNLLTLATVAQLKKRYGNFVVIELCPATPEDKEKIVNTIRTTFPYASSLPNTSSISQMLRWKIPFPEGENTPQYLDALKNLVQMLPIRESCIMRAPLGVVVQNATDVLSEKEPPR
uniref:ABC transporter domain-containing protein n=1 Tax=Haemonchus contortus TaxID=6289 RepID=A0A7I4Y172_HAECO